MPHAPKKRSHQRKESGSRVQQAYEWILLRIVRREFQGRCELKSTLIARAMNASRTPVVQALHRLAADGIVRLAMNKRAVVRPEAENWLIEVHELRELLEPRAAELAATRLTAADLSELSSLAVTAASGQFETNWHAAAERFDFALHLTIAERCGNLPLAEALRKCWSYKRLSYRAADEPAERLEAGVREHLAILDALAARDGTSAAVAMRYHLRMAAVRRPATTIV